MSAAGRARRSTTTHRSAIVALYALMGAIALVIAKIAGVPFLIHHNWLAALLAGGLIGLVVVVLSRISVKHFDWAKRLDNEFHALLGNLSRWDIMILAFCSGIGEELLFRGALLPLCGLELQAVVFGLLHIGPNRHFLPWTLMAVSIGYGFGLMSLEWGLVAPITAHVLINWLNLTHIARTRA